MRSHHIVNGRYFNSGGPISEQFHELVFGVDFSHLSSIMRLLFFPRGLDEMGFEVLGEPRESAGHGSLMPTGNTDIQAT